MSRSRRQIAIEHGLRFIGKPYIFGGQGPVGLDCSGLVVEISRAIGLIGRKHDLSAQGFFNRFSAFEVEVPVPGSFVFFGRSRDKITHMGMVVEIMPCGEALVLEAAGGTRETKTPLQAQKNDAMVTIRPMRGDILAFVDVFKQGE